ncbi:MAG TPA: dephospho-CoA kinase [Fuerstia sp.]|nr:dephospho-CoA kinase [Fuerstiella sp.]
MTSCLSWPHNLHLVAALGEFQCATIHLSAVLPRIQSLTRIRETSSFTVQFPLLSSGSSTSADVARPPVIGILGGIGSGKSSVVRHISSLNLLIIDADRIGHELLLNSEIQSQVRTSFGAAVFEDTGAVDRSRLAQVVFGTSVEQQEALKRLEQILHPAIRRRIQSQIETASRDVDAVILDAALLLEAGWDAECDWLIFVDTAAEIREQRVVRNRGWSAEELARREATQWNLEAKRDRADFIVDNSGLMDDAAANMNQIFTSLLSTDADRQSD